MALWGERRARYSPLAAEDNATPPDQTELLARTVSKRHFGCPTYQVLFYILLVVYITTLAAIGVCTTRWFAHRRLHLSQQMLPQCYGTLSRRARV